MPCPSVYFTFIPTSFTQHEYRSVELLKGLMETNKLQKEFPLKECDYKFIEALITFDKKCKAAREEKKLLEV